MLFASGTFLVFYLIVGSAYWLLRKNEWRKWLLLVASYYFYAAWDWRFLGLIFYSTVLDFWLGRLMDAEQDDAKRRRLLTVSLVSNLGVLFVFKYFNFFAASAVELAHVFGVELGWNTLNLILPVGISFFTFQSMSYTIDVYRRQINARWSFLDFALFVAFFPQLVAGPIVRAVDFLPQLEKQHVFRDIPWKACLLLFAFGLFKKIGIADNLAPTVELIFQRPYASDTATVYIGALFFSVQIYCDFSGYTDMAIALSRTFGFWLPPNFRWPYFAADISDFWRRWHMSLSTWLRDYLYIPLGGSRYGTAMTFRNLFLTMLLGGLWHGAAWTFVIWGALHGAALCIVHGIRLAAAKLNVAGLMWESRLPGIAVVRQLSGIALTYWFVCLAWIYFRASTLASANLMASTYLFQGTGTERLVGMREILILIALTALHFVTYRWRPLETAEDWPAWATGLVVGVIVGVTLLLAPSGSVPFIYFQF